MFDTVMGYLYDIWMSMLCATVVFGALLRWGWKSGYTSGQGDGWRQGWNDAMDGVKDNIFQRRGHGQG